MSTLAALTAMFLGLWFARKVARLAMVLTLVAAVGHYAMHHKVGLRHLVTQTAALAGR